MRHVWRLGGRAAAGKTVWASVAAGFVGGWHGLSGSIHFGLALVRFSAFKYALRIYRFIVNPRFLCCAGTAVAKVGAHVTRPFVDGIFCLPRIGDFALPSAAANILTIRSMKMVNAPGGGCACNMSSWAKPFQRTDIFAPDQDDHRPAVCLVAGLAGMGDARSAGPHRQLGAGLFIGAPRFARCSSA